MMGFCKFHQPPWQDASKELTVTLVACESLGPCSCLFALIPPTSALPTSFANNRIRRHTQTHEVVVPAACHERNSSQVWSIDLLLVGILQVLPMLGVPIGAVLGRTGGDSGRAFTTYMTASAAFTCFSELLAREILPSSLIPAQIKTS